MEHKKQDDRARARERDWRRAVIGSTNQINGQDPFFSDYPHLGEKRKKTEQNSFKFAPQTRRLFIPFSRVMFLVPRACSLIYGLVPMLFERLFHQVKAAASYLSKPPLPSPISSGRRESINI